MFWWRIWKWDLWWILRGIWVIWWWWWQSWVVSTGYQTIDKVGWLCLPIISANKYQSSVMQKSTYLSADESSDFIVQRRTCSILDDKIDQLFGYWSPWWLFTVGDEYLFNYLFCFLLNDFISLLRQATKPRLLKLVDFIDRLCGCCCIVWVVLTVRWTTTTFRRWTFAASQSVISGTSSLTWLPSAERNWRSVHHVFVLHTLGDFTFWLNIRRAKKWSDFAERKSYVQKYGLSTYLDRSLVELWSK